MKMSDESLAVNMQRFAYKPKEMLPPLSWYRGNESGTGQTDLRTEDSAQLNHLVSLEDLDPDDHSYVEDDPKMMGEASSDSLVWMIPKAGGETLRSKQSLNQTKGSSVSNWSTAASQQEDHRKKASALQIPAVTFDLGKEWDDWGDFDDENLLHAASETSLAECKTGAEALIQQRVGYNLSGYPTAPTPVFVSCSQSQPGVTTITTPLRSISAAAASSEIRTLDPSSVSRTLTPKRLTLSLSKEVCRTNIFRGNPEKTAETFPQQPDGAPVSSRLAFFHSPDSPLTRSSSKEEDVFFGIFDGLF